MTTPDPFALAFDSIDLDPVHAPSRALIDRALAACAGADLPGFYLVDDAQGRFVVDRDFGVVSLSDEALLEALRGQVVAVRLRVVESSGDSYTLDMKLRVTGMVPQLLGAEDLLGIEPASAPAQTAAAQPVVPWIAFAPVCGAQTKAELTPAGAFGGLFVWQLPPSEERIAIAFADRPPGPTPSHLAWSP